MRKTGAACEKSPSQSRLVSEIYRQWNNMPLRSDHFRWWLYRLISRKVPDAVADTDHMLNKNTARSRSRSQGNPIHAYALPFWRRQIVKISISPVKRCLRRDLFTLAVDTVRRWRWCGCRVVGSLKGSRACLPDPYCVSVCVPTALIDACMYTRRFSLAAEKVCRGNIRVESKQKHLARAAPCMIMK
jgi:hypothetical protein